MLLDAEQVTGHKHLCVSGCQMDQDILLDKVDKPNC